MSGFLGSYRHQIDDKGRLSLPASFRRGEEGTSLVLVQTNADCLTLYPEESWEEVEQRLRELLRRQPDSRSWVLSVTSNAVEVTPDRQGRILIPQRLQDVAELNGTALVVGAIDRIEIWQPERFERSVAVKVDDQEKFAHHVFA